jgi:hypothetical protein
MSNTITQTVFYRTLSSAAVSPKVMSWVFTRWYLSHSFGADATDRVAKSAWVFK